MICDLLDRVHPVAEDLLSRVEAVFSAHGAPAEHRVWTAARRVGATPRAAVAHFHGLHTQDLHATAERMRADADIVVNVSSLPEIVWSGGGADSYEQARSALRGFLGDVDGGLLATAEHLDAVADWIGRSRDSIARELAVCIGSREAVSIRNADEFGAARAAADVTAHILASIADCVEEGWDVHGQWSGALGAATWRGPDTSTAIAFKRIDLR